MIDTDRAQEILEALRERRSIPKVRPELPPRGLVERVIEVGTWGPNHHRTRPWRFVVLTGEQRETLGDVMAAELAERLDNPESAEGKRALEKQRAKPLRAPVLIVAATVPSTGPKVVEIEEIAAVAAGVENMLLAAEALGLGAMWRTGWPAYNPAVKRFLGLPDAAHIVAFLYVGWPDVPRVPRHHEPLDGLIDWRWEL